MFKIITDQRALTFSLDNSLNVYDRYLFRFFFEIQTSQTDYGHDLNYPGTTVECDNQICKFELFTDWYLVWLPVITHNHHGENDYLFRVWEFGKSDLRSAHDRYFNYFHAGGILVPQTQTPDRKGQRLMTDNVGRRTIVQI